MIKCTKCKRGKVKTPMPWYEAGDDLHTIKCVAMNDTIKIQVPNTEIDFSEPLPILIINQLPNPMSLPEFCI